MEIVKRMNVTLSVGLTHFSHMVDYYKRLYGEDNITVEYEYEKDQIFGVIKGGIKNEKIN